MIMRRVARPARPRRRIMRQRHRESRARWQRQKGVRVLGLMDREEFALNKSLDFGFSREGAVCFTVVACYVLCILLFKQPDCQFAS